VSVAPYPGLEASLNVNGGDRKTEEERHQPSNIRLMHPERLPPAPTSANLWARVKTKDALAASSNGSS